MKKITILTLHLNYGGVPKTIASLVNNLNDYEIEIISLYKIKDKPAFKINKNIKIKYLTDKIPSKKEWLNSIKKINVIKFIKESYNNAYVLFLVRKQKMIKAIKNCKSDIVISTTTSMNQKLVKYGNKNILKIGWEHNNHKWKKNYANLVTKNAKDLDYLVVVSENEQKYFQERLKDYKCKPIYISNVLDELPKENCNIKSKNIISVGRLEIEKGYDDLIKVFNLVNKKYPEWKLNIVGDGILKDSLIELSKKYKLENNIIFHGFLSQKEVKEKLLNSSIFAMTSHTESFGLVLIEAMSYSVPCIAFSSADGAVDIISDNSGYLIDNRDLNEMSEKIIDLIENESLREEIGNKGKAGCKKYLPDMIIKKWRDIIESKK